MVDGGDRLNGKAAQVLESLGGSRWQGDAEDRRSPGEEDGHLPPGYGGRRRVDARRGAGGDPESGNAIDVVEVGIGCSDIGEAGRGSGTVAHGGSDSRAAGDVVHGGPHPQRRPERPTTTGDDRVLAVERAGDSHLTHRPRKIATGHLDTGHGCQTQGRRDLRTRESDGPTGEGILGRGSDRPRIGGRHQVGQRHGVPEAFDIAVGVPAR